MERVQKVSPDLKTIASEAGTEGIGAASMVEQLVFKYGYTEEGAVRFIDDEVSNGGLLLDSSFNLKVAV